MEYVPAEVYVTIRDGLASLRHLRALESGEASSFRYNADDDKSRCALYDACCAGVDVKDIGHFLANDAWHTSSLEIGRAFFAAIKYCHCEIVRYFIENGCIDFDSIHSAPSMRLGQRGFLCACQYGHEDIVKLFFTLKGDTIDMNYTHLRKRTALMTACAHGHCEIIQFLISKGQDILDAKAQNEAVISGFMSACEAGRLEVVELLFSLAPDTIHVKVRDNMRRTALMYACMESRLEIVRLLFSLAPDTIDLNAWDLWANSPGLCL